MVSDGTLSASANPPTIETRQTHALFFILVSFLLLLVHYINLTYRSSIRLNANAIIGMNSLMLSQKHATKGDL
jgi:hypothetical protein